MRHSEIINFYDIQYSFQNRIILNDIMIGEIDYKGNVTGSSIQDVTALQPGLGLAALN